MLIQDLLCDTLQDQLNSSSIFSQRSFNDIILEKKNEFSSYISQKKQQVTKKILEIIQISQKKKLSQLQIMKQVKLGLKSILNQNKNQLLGGGSCCSKGEINEQNFNTIKIIDETQNNNNQNKEFENEYKNWTQQEVINKNIQQDTQLKVQKRLLKECIISHIIQSDDLINSYKSEIQYIFETYLMLEVTKVSNKSDAQQEEFENILKDIQSLDSYQQDYPIMELVFYAEMLTNLNKVNYKFDGGQQKQIIQIKEYLNKILNLKKNGDFSTIISCGNDIQQSINIFDKKKELFPLKYFIYIWQRKVEQFGEKFNQISEEEEVIFYMNIFFEIYKKQDYQDQIILTLIRINFIFEKFQKEKSQQSNKSQTYLQFSNGLIKENIDQFLSELMQKQDQFMNQLFLMFSIENQYYRYIALSILLSINSIYTIAFKNIQHQEYLLDFLCNKYLTEQELAIRVIFEKSIEFVEYFNQNIKTESFKKKMIEFDQQRKQKLQPLVPSLKNYERSINSFNDIIKLISDNAIQKWEIDIKKRQRSNLAQKDDVLLEVRDLYINQMITYLRGNPIFEKSNLNNEVKNVQSIHQQNALSNILNQFLNNNNSIQSIQNKEGNNDEGNKLKNQSNQCQILGILAEGGTGKSMLMKKIETFLIEKLTKLNTETETGNYLPILVKCNSLDPKKPSLDEYLNQQGINEDMVKSLKQNERNKLILFDGYDEYTGDYFTIYSTLKINEWKNTKIIVATRKEKLSEKDACLYFSKQTEKGQIDETSYTLVKLEEFTTKDIHEYAERYFKKERKTDEIKVIENDLKNLRDCLTNLELEKLLHLPINLYLFTRMLVNLKDKETQNLKRNVSDQIGIQEIFFSDQFEREAQSYIDAYINSLDQKRDNNFRTSIKNCYFEYFQTIAMQMFLNRGVIQSNYLQVERQHVNFKISQYVTMTLQPPQVISLEGKIKNYINSKIITRVKSDQQLKINKSIEKQQQQQFIEFKHKSLYEYFAARAMKIDFDTHGENIYKLKIDELEQFKINQKSIMNGGSNQSEQQILIKIYKLIKTEIESEEFRQNYHENQIEKNNRYIQYLKRSQIQTNTDISKIDIGASNLISALFISKFSFSKLNLSLCSFSKAYISTPKNLEIKFDRCNFHHAFLQNSRINFDTCNTQLASLDAFSKVFDSLDIYSFKKVLWGKSNVLYSISESGYINSFQMTNQGIQLFMSKQLSQSSLTDIQKTKDNHFLVPSKYTLFLINSNSFEVIKSHKFTLPISAMTLIEENILVVLKKETVLRGTFEDGFQKLNNLGRVWGLAYNQIHKILLTYENESYYIWNTEKGFELINTIQGHSNRILSVAFSANGKYLATGSYDQTCKIWNVEKGFELTFTTNGHTEPILSVIFSEDGKYLTTGSEDKTCKIWNSEQGFELINTIQGHTDYINSTAFSADGKFFATGSKDKTCKIWNQEKGFELINTTQGHSLKVTSVAFSVDGKYLATSSYDKTCKIWNAEQGYQLMNTIQGHNDWITSVAFSSDGKYLATGSRDYTCKIWNVMKCFELINTIQGLTKYVISVAFSADGKYLAIQDDAVCKLWSPQKGFELINTIQGHTQKICCVSFSADGKYLGTGSDDKTCKIWDTEKGFELLNTISEHTQSVNSIAFSANGKYLATGSYDQTCKIWNQQKDFNLIITIKGHAESISSVIFSADGKYLATGSYDYTCKIWNIEKGFELINTIQRHTSYLTTITFSVDGKYLVTGSWDQTFKIWNIEKGFELINTIQGHTDRIWSVAISADEKYIATGSCDSTYKIWNAEKGYELIKTIKGHASDIWSVTFSADGKYLATGSFDKTCKIWNTEKGFELINTIQGHTDKIWYVVFSPDGKYLATGSSDNTFKIWNAEKDFELINTIQGHNEAILSIAFSADGKYLATGASDNTCKIWNIKKGFELISTIEGHTYRIQSVAFSADGKYLATGSFDQTCKIWNAEKGFDLISTIQGHTEGILSVAFSKDGKYLATCSNDHTCKIWNAEKGFELVNIIQGHTSSVLSIAFNSDGKYLATTSEDQTCQIWNLEKLYQLKTKIDSKSKIEISRDYKHILVEQTDKTCKIYDLTLDINKVMNEQIKDTEKVKEKYQFKQIKISDFQQLNLSENLYIL